MSTQLADTGLVHGSGFEIIDDTYYMSPGSRLNADRAAQLLAGKAIAQVLCSGRGPVPDATYGSSESLLMADYLVSIGFSAKQIEVEEESTSTVGNWAHSAPILLGMDAQRVVGVAAPVSVARSQLVGNFVATRSDFELVGYEASAKRTRARDYARELIAYNLTTRFLGENSGTAVEDLADAYETFKQERGLAQLKGFLHRKSAAPTAAE